MLYINWFINFPIVVLAICKVAVSWSDEELIEPVDMAYYCIEIEIDEESEAKSPILLLHGLGASKRIWNRTDVLLAHQTNRRVCVVDLRNHGDSPWNNRTDVEALVVDIDNFLDKQCIDKVNIIGHSLGGKTAIHYTLNNPDRVDSIIVEDMVTNTVPDEVLFQMSLLFRIQKIAVNSIPEGITSQDVAAKSYINILNKKLEEVGSKERLPDEFAEYIELKLVDGKWQFKSNIDVLVEAAQNPKRFLTKSTGLYEGPTMFIYGTKSPMKVNEDKENILELFPNAELVPVEGAGHQIHGFFREFEDAVVAFLKKVN